MVDRARDSRVHRAAGSAFVTRRRSGRAAGGHGVDPDRAYRRAAVNASLGTVHTEQSGFSHHTAGDTGRFDATCANSCDSALNTG